MDTLALLHQFDRGKPACSGQMETVEYVDLRSVDARTGRHQLSVFLERSLVWIHFDLPGRQGRQIEMLLVAPYHAKTLALALRVPTGSIFIFHQIREEDPAQNRLGTGGANPRLFQG